MLTSLHIQDFVLIDRADLTIERGLTALTGETGAGKSILLDALGLAIGGRSERAAVRQGADQGVVIATFEPGGDHEIWNQLRDDGLDTGEGQIILRRILNKDGRSRGFVNDQPVSIAALRKVGETLLEIHGQHDGRGFLAVAGHRAMLDEFAGLEAKRKKAHKFWAQWSSLRERLDEKRRLRDASLREIDYLRHVVERLEALDPRTDEETALAERRSILMAAERIGEDLNAAAAALEEGGVSGKLSVALRSLTRAAGRIDQPDDSLTLAMDEVAKASEAIDAASVAIDRCAEIYGPDNAALEDAEERLFALRAEARKHGVSADRLPEVLARAKEALETATSDEEAFNALEAEIADASKSYHAIASTLSKARAKAAHALDKAVAQELSPLKLGRAQFNTQIDADPDNPGPDGYDRVEFMVATNPGAPPGPLRSIASGGELSRFVLAMKAALAAKESRTVIIFDEVDAGVGGAVADAVGERLARLASDTQVLVVTHSPQVAARAVRQWKVSKSGDAKNTLTHVDALDQEARKEEIARMLSGADVTDEARAAAATLLAGAGIGAGVGAGVMPGQARKKRAAPRKKPARK